MAIETEIRCDNPACGNRDDWPVLTTPGTWLIVHVATPKPTTYNPNDSIHGEHTFCGWPCLSAWVRDV